MKDSKSPRKPIIKTCCKCREEFTVQTRNQRTCSACLEIANQAATAKCAARSSETPAPDDERAARWQDVKRRIIEAPVDVREQCILLMLSHIVDALQRHKAEPVPAVEVVNPEQVAHPDQDHIDAVAAVLLEDIDL